MSSVPPSPFAPPRGPRGLLAPSPTVWGAIRHELLYIGFALMEVALITPAAMMVLGWARYWPPLQLAAWLFLLMLLPLNLLRVMGLLGVSLRRQRVALIGALLLVIFASWRLLLYEAASLFDFGWLRQFAGTLGDGGNLLWTRDLSVFLLTAFIWWRGIRLAIRSPEINNVGLRLRLGGLILLPLLIWFSGSFRRADVVPFVLLFFLSALVVISLVRAENIEREKSGMAATLNARWFAAVATAALGIVVASGVLASILAGESLFVVLAILSPVWRAVQFGAAVVGVLLFKLAYPALVVLAGVLQFLSGALGGVLGGLSAVLGDLNLFSELDAVELPAPEERTSILGPLLTSRPTTALIMVVLVVLVALTLARSYRHATFAARESERSQVAGVVAEGGGRGRRWLDRLGLLRGRRAASVRRIYRQMCRSAASAGFPRVGTETPYEYLSTLARAWPHHTAETQLITEAFVRVRYGEIPETAAELDALRAAWRRLEAAEPAQQAAAEQTATLAKRE